MKLQKLLGVGIVGSILLGTAASADFQGLDYAITSENSVDGDANWTVRIYTVMDQGDRLAAYFAVQTMALKYQDQVGREGQMVRGKAPKASGDVFNSQPELIQAMEDPRYNDDPAYREAILQKLDRSNINF